MTSHSRDITTNITLEAPSAIGAMEETLFTYGEDHWILAAYPLGERVDQWRLIYADYWERNPPARYTSLEQALRENEQDGEILVAIPA